MDKRELIIEAALKLFVENGFHGTATSKIAQEAGVATGTLFNYFKTKDELVIALYITLKDEMADYSAKTTLVNTDIKAVMKSQFIAALSWALENIIKFRFVQQVHNSPYIGQVDQAIIEKHTQPHLALIQKGIDEHLIKPLPVDFIYSLISSNTFGMFQYITTKQLSQNEQKTIIQETFEMIWDMLT